MEKITNLMLTICVISITIFTSCRSARTDENVIKPPPDGKYILVTVRDYTNLDGCNYLLEMENGQKLEPKQWPGKYSKDGLKVYVQYKKIEGMSICMAGVMVDITAIHPAE